MLKSWRKYIFHPLTIGFLLSLSVIFVFARFLPRYESILIEEAELNNKGEVYYFDLNNDGSSEKLNYYHYDKIFQPTLYLYDADNNFKLLWNFFESPLENSNMFVGQRLDDKIADHPSVIGVHARTVGVKYANHFYLELILTVIVKKQRFSATLAFIIT